MKFKFGAKALSFLLAATTTLGAFSMTANADWASYYGSATTQREAFQSAYQTYWKGIEMKKYPDGKYWNSTNANCYTDTTALSRFPGNTYSGSRIKSGLDIDAATGTEIKLDTIYMTECAGFAKKLAIDFYGLNGSNEMKLGWMWNDYKPKSVKLRVGDQVRINDQHSIFITNINSKGDTVEFADCNSDGHNIIRWNNKATFTSDKKALKIGTSAWNINYVIRPLMVGDIDGDGAITSIDQFAIRQLADPTAYGAYDYFHVNKIVANTAADINNDGYITNEDYLLVCSIKSCGGVSCLADYGFVGGFLGVPVGKSGTPHY